MKKPLLFLPKSTNFSAMEAEAYEERIEFGFLDPGIEHALDEAAFLFILKTLPKDRYRVIALLLFLKYEMGYEYTYEDMAGIWGHSKVNIFNTIKRMKGVLSKAGLTAE